MNNNNDKYGDFFQQRSKYYRGKLPRHSLDWKNKPKTYKYYEDAIEKIQLPTPKFNEKIGFWDVIRNRKSSRSYSNNSITLMELSLLLFGISGITREYPQFAFRTVPSAGGLFPIETYAVINNVKDITPGIFHYNISEHKLELLKKGDFKQKVVAACLDQTITYNSAVNFIWTAVIERSKWKYLQRCYLYLVAEALDLGACTIGAIYDDELNQLLEIDGMNETSIYVGVVGKK